MNTALVCIAKDEDDYMQEWATYHLKLGFDEVFVYENNWRCSCRTFSERVHFIPFHGKVMQLPAYNTFIREHGDEFTWAAFIDVDEFVANTTKVSFKGLLSMKSNAPQLGVNWRLMGSNGLHEESCATKSVLSRFTMGDKELNKHVKQLVNLGFFKRNGLPHPTFINPHCTNHYSTSMLGQLFYGPFQENSLKYTTHDLEIYHYAVKTPEELHRKVMRGRADTTITREAEEAEYFKNHDKNDIPCLYAKEFMEHEV